jgi:uncharacterized protein (DUF305 family)
MIRTAAVFVVALTVVACSGPRAATDTSTDTSADVAVGQAEQETATVESKSVEDEAELARLEELYWAEQERARSLYTDAEIHFMTGMISHHAQALVMSRMAPTHGASPHIQVLASRIINAQNDEIATMQRWLRNRGEEAPEIHEMGGNIMVHGAADHDMHMPGMLSPEQLEELENARDTEFDRLFLTYMIQHHNGALVMVDELFGTDGAGQDEEAFKLANDIHADQETEIKRMGLMLDALGDAGDDR